MNIGTAEYVISNTDITKCPKPTIPEYAFIGRSNVGKSSLINMLTGNNKLAKTSARPGKTQLINHFIINKESKPWYLVDLPGYGFAKVPKKLAEKWLAFSKHYLRSRENLMCVFLLLDSRHSPQRVDLDFMEWLGTNQIPFVMVFTKMDKLSPSQVSKNILDYKKKMLNTMWEALPQTFITSAKSDNGKKEILDFIEQTNELFERP